MLLKYPVSSWSILITRVLNCASNRLAISSSLSCIVSGALQEAHRVPKKLEPRRNTPRHIIVTLPKIKKKKRILKAAREKDTVTYKGVPIRLSADFSKETLQARRGQKEVFQVMKGKDLHPRLLYPAKLSFRMKVQIKCFPDKVRITEMEITGRVISRGVGGGERMKSYRE